MSMDRIPRERGPGPPTNTVSKAVEAIQSSIANLVNRVRDIEDKEEAESSRGHPHMAFASLPAAAAGNRGWAIYVTNGRKMGEGVGAGTGVMAYSDGVAWRRYSDDTTVAA